LAACIALFAVGYFVVLEQQLDWRNAAGSNSRAAQRPTNSGGIRWLPWSRAAVEEARANGRAVLVDFTADWCVTCQANKKTSIEIDAVRRKLEETDTLALLGDYTLRDDAIAQELRRFGRAGVPLVLVYPREPEVAPIVLPELLTPGLVLEALDRGTR
jgi:thiol:disulfide interchange protein DsbD